ncbi:MAG: hypothetical protein H0W81_04760 [Chloroflexi bacterium]|nr:hypothetical protein [Chloroflexota bacterium]
MLFLVRGADGTPQAIHERIEKPDGKAFRWWSVGPEGNPVIGLQDRSSLDLPLFGSERVSGWDRSQPIIVCEGEKDALALIRAGWQALGTVTGAPACHHADAFSILRGFGVLLWPDADQAGAEQMLKAARALDPVAASVLWLVWEAAPPGGGASDYLVADLDVNDLIVAAVRVPVPPPAMRPEGRRRVPWREVSLAPRSDVASLSRAVRQAGGGNRNALLFWAAHKAADSGIPRDVAEGDLLDAFLADEPTTIREREGRATIRSAYRP